MRIYKQSTHFVDRTGFLIKKYKMNISTHLHTHDFVEIAYVISGSGTHSIGGVDYIITDNSIFFVPVGQSHNLVFSGVAEYFNIFCTINYAKKLKLFNVDSVQKNAYDYMKDSSDNSLAIYLDPDSASEVSDLFNKVYLEFCSKKPFFDEIIHSCFKLIMISVIRADTKTRNSTKSNLSHIVLPRVIDYINAHYQEKITLHSIAQKYNYNPAYFGRLFNKNYGITLNKYIIKIRIEHSCELLFTTNYSISEISSLVGFSSTVHFYRYFDELYHCTPKEYRVNEIKKDNRTSAN